MSDPTSQSRGIAEPRLALLAFVAVLVGVLCVVALADTDAIWVLAIAVVAVVLIAVVIVMDFLRIVDDDDST